MTLSVPPAPSTEGNLHRPIPTGTGARGGAQKQMDEEGRHK
jgi:hypothetical protein